MNRKKKRKEKRKKRKNGSFLPSSPSFSVPRLFAFHFRLYFIRSYKRTGFVSPLILPLSSSKVFVFH
jgi:hypothetical protein